MIYKFLQKSMIELGRSWFKVELISWYFDKQTFPKVPTAKLNFTRLQREN